MSSGAKRSLLPLVLSSRWLASSSSSSFPSRSLSSLGATTSSSSSSSTSLNIIRALTSHSTRQISSNVLLNQLEKQQQRSREGRGFATTSTSSSPPPPPPPPPPGYTPASLASVQPRMSRKQGKRLGRGPGGGSRLAGRGQKGQKARGCK